MRCKNSGQAMLEKLQGQQRGSNAISQDLQQQNIDIQLDTQPTINITPPSSTDDNLASSSSPNETQSRQKEDPFVVKIRDTSTREITTRKMQANQVWHLEKNEKVIVEINGNGQGNDNGSNLLVRFLGKLAQNSAICPISVEKWHWMPIEKRIQQWNSIEEHFEFDYVAGIKWAMSTLGEKWKAYKYKLRCKYFYPNKNKEELLANPPLGVDGVDWTAFVHHYKDEKMKALSLQNTINRKKLKVTHAGGSKSNARRGREMEHKLGRPVCRSEVILSTLLKKNGNYVNEDGKVLADKIFEHVSQDQERAATLGVPSKILAHCDDAIGKVCGVEHSGRVRGLGIGVCPSPIFGLPRNSTNYLNFSGSTNNVDNQCIQDLKKQVETLQEKLTGYDETKAQLATLHKFLQDKFGSELHSVYQDISHS